MAYAPSDISWRSDVAITAHASNVPETAEVPGGHRKNRGIAMKRYRRGILAMVSVVLLLVGMGGPAQASVTGKRVVTCGWFAKSAQYHGDVYVGEMHTSTYTTGSFHYSNENGTTIETTVSSDFGVTWAAASYSYRATNSSSTSYTSPTIATNRHIRYYADFIFQDYAQSCSSGAHAVLTGAQEVRPIQWTGGMTANTISYGSHSPPDCSVNYPAYTSPSGNAAGTYARVTTHAFTSTVGATLHGFGVSVSTDMSSSNSVTYVLSRVAELCGSNGTFSSATGVLYSSNH